MRKNKIISEKQLLKILHLKKYEKADENRLAHNRQQIYNLISDIDHIKKPQFFDEIVALWNYFRQKPKYILSLSIFFIALFGISFLINEKSELTVDSSIKIEKDEVIEENELKYPDLPENIRLFESPLADETVIPTSYHAE